MPFKPLVPCPGRCGRKVTSGRCAPCRAAYERARGTRQERGLGAEYERERRALIGEPCALRLPGCTGVATTADHVIPRARGGRGGPLQPACDHCNYSKGARLVTA
jgi:5-methylcytosine-specific restriction endonuclease McrA